MDIRIHDATFELALVVADNLREEVRRELEVASGKSAHEAIFRSLAASDPDLCFVISSDGEPVAMVGFTQEAWGGGGSTRCWMVLTKAFEKHPLYFTKEAKKYLKRLMSAPKVTYLHCTVMAAYEENLRWLKVLGFKRADQQIINGRFFYRLYMTRASSDADKEVTD